MTVGKKLYLLRKKIRTICKPSHLRPTQFPGEDSMFNNGTLKLMYPEKPEKDLKLCMTTVATKLLLKPTKKRLNLQTNHYRQHLQSKRREKPIHGYCLLLQAVSFSLKPCKTTGARQHPRPRATMVQANGEKRTQKNGFKRVLVVLTMIPQSKQNTLTRKRHLNPTWSIQYRSPWTNSPTNRMLMIMHLCLLFRMERRWSTRLLRTH
mmetsp:Transcript_16644/g.25835  ORF Transcript_16644/g.25835 Transcript_16644/m.25835 type:complete len:207 (+) Transcript_16644:135-755(+)